jgi:hypothetical protein
VLREVLRGMKRQFRQAYVEPTSEQDELLRWKRAHREEAQIQSRMGKRGPPPSKRPACGCVNPNDVEKARLVWQEARIPSVARWARNTKRYSRLVTLGERLETIRTDMRELGVLDDLNKIERRHAVFEGSWRRVQQREATLSEVERLKQVATQISQLSESAIDALADNSTDLDVRDWLSRAPYICAIAERAETALLEKRRRAPSPRVQQWLIAELAGIYVQAHGVDFSAGSRGGPGTKFVQTCAEYIGLVEIERELRGLDRNDRTPKHLYLNPPLLPGETIKTLLRRTKAEKRQSEQ